MAAGYKWLISIGFLNSWAEFGAKLRENIRHMLLPAHVVRLCIKDDGIFRSSSAKSFQGLEVRRVMIDLSLENPRLTKPTGHRSTL